MTITEVLSHFDNVKGAGPEWNATCPCHDDRVNSLCIGYENGKVLLRCQAGCDTNDILGAVGLKMKDLFDDNENGSTNKGKAKKKLEKSKWESASEKYEYRNGNRKLKWKQRDGSKVCAWDHKEKDGFWYKGRNSEKNMLYLAGDISDNIVFIPEGEKDAERVNRTACVTAVSVEHGADDKGTGWLKSYTDELKGKTCYVIPDNDDVGMNFARHVCRKLSGKAEKVYLLDLKDVWPDIHEHGDYSDMADNLGDTEAAKLLLSMTQTAVPFDNDNVEELEETENLPLNLRFGKYDVSESEGVTFTEYDKDGNPNQQLICSHPIMPIMVYRDIETGIERYKIWYRIGSCERDMSVSGEQIFTATKIPQLSNFGISVSSTTAKYLVNYFREIIDGNRETIPVQKSVNRMGWVDGTKAFVPYDKEITYDGDVSYQAAVDAIHCAGDFDVWKTETGKCRAYSKEVQIFMAAAFASVLIGPLGGMPFISHIWSITSGSGKTVVLMIAASIYGDPVVGNGYAVSMDGTNISSERRAAMLCNLPFCLDEAQTLRKDSHGNALFDPYKLTEGVSRDRSNVNLGLNRMSHWSNVFLTTGETPLLSDETYAGAQNRVIEIACQPGQKLVDNGFETSNIMRKNFGWAGKAWIEELQKDGRMDEIRKEVLQVSSQLVQQGITDKQAQAAAFLIVADKFSCQLFWPDQDALTVDDIIPYLKSEESVDTGARAYDYLVSWIAENSHKFITENGLNAEEQGNRKVETYGVIDRPDSFDGITYANIIKKVFDSACGEGGFNGRALLSWLKSKDKLMTERDGVWTYKKKINGKSLNVVRMALPKGIGGIQDSPNPDPDIAEDNLLEFPDVF